MENESETDMKMVVKVQLEIVDNNVVAGYACGKRNRDFYLIKLILEQTFVTNIKQETDKEFTSAENISRHIEGFTSWTFSPEQNDHRVPIEMQFPFFFFRDAQESC